MSSSMQRFWAGILVTGFACSVAQQAEAARFGELRITRNTTLTDDQYGSVIIDADNITLDCADRMVHTSSHSKLNCLDPFPGGTLKRCGIVATGRSNVTVKNCDVVGNFDYGVLFNDTKGSTVQNVSSNSVFGFMFFGNEEIFVENIASNHSAQRGVQVSYDTAGSYAFVSVGSAGVFGILLGNSHLTYFYRPDVANAGAFGFATSENTDVWLDQAFIEGGRGVGIDSAFDTRLGMIASTSSGNAKEGLKLRGTRNSSFSGNTVADNGASCDAYQDVTSTGNTWRANSLQSWCGTIPATH